MEIKPTGQGGDSPDEQNVSEVGQAVPNTPVAMPQQDDGLRELRQNSPALARLLEMTRQGAQPGSAQPGGSGKRVASPAPGKPQSLMEQDSPLQPDDRDQVLYVLKEIVPDDFGDDRMELLYHALCAVEDREKLEMAIDVCLTSEAVKIHQKKSLVALLVSSITYPNFARAPAVNSIMNAIQMSEKRSVMWADRVVLSIQKTRDLFFPPTPWQGGKPPIAVTEDDQLLQNVLVLGLREGSNPDRLDALIAAIQQSSSPDMLVETCKEIELARQLEKRGSSLRAHYKLPPPGSGSESLKSEPATDGP